MIPQENKFKNLKENGETASIKELLIEKGIFTKKEIDDKIKEKRVKK